MNRADLESLTPRQHETLRLAARHLKTEEIAHEMGIEVKTVEAHVAAIMQKLAVGSRRQAVRLFLEAQADDPGKTLSDLSPIAPNISFPTSSSPEETSSSRVRDVAMAEAGSFDPGPLADTLKPLTVGERRNDLGSIDRLRIIGDTAIRIIAYLAIAMFATLLLQQLHQQFYP